MLDIYYRLECEIDTMSNGENTGILVLALALLLSSCDSKHERLLNPNILKSPTSFSQFETFKEDPSDNLGHVSSDETGVEEVRINEIEGSESEEDQDEFIQKKHSLKHQENLENGSTQFMPYNRPPPPPTFPPTPTDDENLVADDDFLYNPLENPYLAPWAKCGDGIVQPLEQCDLGKEENALNSTTNLIGCNIICKLPYCGNGVTESITTGTVTVTEQCDDGNNENGDGCSSTCFFERCGNGRLDPDEQCDNGTFPYGTTGTTSPCSPCCLYEACGNGVLDAHEECDDGNMINGDGCDNCITQKT
jgi:cysteine-rich repeat protein